MPYRNRHQPPTWARNVLHAAAIYNLVWGAGVILAPLAIFRWAGMEPPRYPQIWQCVGMIVGVYGVGYWIAATDPFRHWPIVLVGFLGKIFGPIGFLQAAISGSLPWTWGITIITNDLIWWIPFASILYLAFRHNTDTTLDTEPVDRAQALREFRSHRNATLQELSEQSPTLVVFLRHSGCTFCRESLARLHQAADQIRQAGVTIAVVHMGPPIEGTLLLQKRDLPDLHRFSDPQCVLYQAFELERGQIGQLFSPHIIWKGVQAILRGHGVGKLSGDGFRMPGAFVLINGNIVTEHRSQTADDHPPFDRLLREASAAWSRHRGEHNDTAVHAKPTATQG